MSVNSVVVSDDDSGNYMDNFKITYEMSAGQTVYIRVRGYSAYTSWPFEFHVEMQS